MVFGFGFNKAKVLASAEKNVKAGKLQNAIADYERVLKEDPKDLTVMNTVGDLYARVGKSDKATDYFRKVGQVYVRDGFTVKAIAMYKKLTKQDPGALDAVQKLAELYTQQGLYSDARSQYMQLADINLRKGESSAAAEMFKRILDLDPENYGLQRKLADIYAQVGNKKEEARDLYFRNATALRTKSSLQDADEALGKCLEIDPKFPEAIQLRGQIRMELDDPDGAVQALEQLPDIDSRPEALRTLLNAYLKKRNLPEAEPIARKLLKVFNDVSGVSDYADALISNGECEKALEFYREHADQLFMADMAKGTAFLQSTIARVNTNTKALQILAELFQRSGNTGNFVEVTELLAHACAASGDMAKAAELYRKLIDLEPDNPQHVQNFRQVTAHGGHVIVAEKVPSAQEAGSTLEDISATQTVEQKYTAAVQEAIQAAITDAELFESYNLAAKAIPTLQAALKAAPRDVRLNIKLVTLYAGCGKLTEAVRCCETLESVYRENGSQRDAEQFGALAAKYRKRAGLAPIGDTENKGPATAPLKETQPASDAEREGPAVEIKAAATPVQTVPSHEPQVEQVHEFDLSDEWEQMVEVEASAENQPNSPKMEEVERHGEDVGAASSSTTELLEELRFYISQGMWREARTAFGRFEKLAPDLPELASLRSQLADGETGASSSEMSSEPGLMSHAASRQNESFQEVSSAAAAPQLAPEVPPSTAAADEFGSFVADLESSLGSDFNLAPAASAPAPAAPLPPAAMPAAVDVPAPTAPHQLPDEPSMLGDIFTEFKESMEAGSDNHEDPEIHYNLGVAFKEMGLLDEAIGELQKVCQAIERGYEFQQAIQAYTWLADAFLQKGVPEAAIRWYETALKGRQVDAETATAIHYELACACEAAADRSGALKHFMEVYGSNIDYRDVAERIKGLKS